MGYWRSWLYLHWQTVYACSARTRRGFVCVHSTAPCWPHLKPRYFALQRLVLKLRTVTCYWNRMCLWGGVGTLFGSSLVFHSIFVIEGRRSSSACDLSSAVIKAEGWVISGWTGTNCRELCRGDFLLHIIPWRITSLLCQCEAERVSEAAYLCFR